MSRCALLVSLALHAGLMVLLSRWTPAPRDGSGTHGAAASAAAGSTELLLVEAAPAAPPVAAPLLAAPQISPPQLPVRVLNGLADAPFALPSSIAVAPGVRPPPADTAPAKSDEVRSRVSIRSGKSGKGQHGSTAGSGAGERSGSGHASEETGFVPPQFRLRYKPPYPAAARAQRMHGTVLLLVSVDSVGRVTNAHLQSSCGHALLDRAALDAVRSWRFEPARQHGVATSAQVEVPVRFRLG